MTEHKVRTISKKIISTIVFVILFPVIMMVIAFVAICLGPTMVILGLYDRIFKRVCKYDGVFGLSNTVDRIENIVDDVLDVYYKSK